MGDVGFRITVRPRTGNFGNPAPADEAYRTGLLKTDVWEQSWDTFYTTNFGSFQGAASSESAVLLIKC